MKSQIPIKGLILAGGKSSRMGEDKSLIKYHGKEQREHLFDLLQLFCNEVFLSCKRADTIPGKLNPLPDLFEINSPLNGILSAFHHDPQSAWLTVAVDMPLIDSTTIAFLLKHRDHSRVATCCLDSDNKFPEPLFTLWEPTAFESLLSFYKAGRISPREFLIQSDTKLMEIPDKKVLTNINSKDDLVSVLGIFPKKE